MQESLEFAQSQIPAHDERITGIESVLVDFRAAVKAICDGKSSFERVYKEQVLTSHCERTKDARESFRKMCRGRDVRAPQDPAQSDWKR